MVHLCILYLWIETSTEFTLSLKKNKQQQKKLNAGLLTGIPQNISFHTPQNEMSKKSYIWLTKFQEFLYIAKFCYLKEIFGQKTALS